MAMIMSHYSNKNKKIKFHYSYGGKIIFDAPTVRYAGGTHGILSVDRSITYTELIMKLWDTSAPSMRLWCKLPRDDVFHIVPISCDKDLACVIQLYDRCGKDNLKIRLILDDFPETLVIKLIADAPCDGFLGRKATQCVY
uniref:uncharacterized protein LOC122592460 n=1 Tax=Erigeron canadensis TaxID=72917 RepID=UPI001CB92352|nr:uncharacterized protein LOC122592460 [Erigeron canadensis]